MKTLWFRYTYIVFLIVSYKNPRVILLLYSCIWYVFHDMDSFFHIGIIPFIYILYIIIISEIRIIICDYIIIDISFIICDYIIIDISFMFCFLGRVMGSRIYRILVWFLLGCYFPFYVLFFGYILLCCDRDIFSFYVLLFLGSMIISGILCSFIFYILSLWGFFILFVLYVIIYHRLGDKDYLMYYLFYVFVWGYGHIILVIINFLDYCYLYHRAGIYFILWCDIPFYLCSFGS